MKRKEMRKEMPQHILSKERTCAKKGIEYVPKRFAQAFLKLDTWCKSMRGRSSAKGGAIQILKKIGGINK